MVKTEEPIRTSGDSSTAVAAAILSQVEATTKPVEGTSKKKRTEKAPKHLTAKTKELMKNQRKQARVLEVILKRSKSNKK